MPSIENLRGAFTTRAQTISAWSGDSEDQARNRHHSHGHWLGVLEHSAIELAEAVAIFADILPRKAPQKLRDLTKTVVPALQEQVVSKMWSEGFRRTALTLLVAGVRIDGGWEKLLGSRDSKSQGARLCALLEHLEEEDRALAATTVIDAMDSRGRNKVQFDDFGKPAGASACVFWHETYDWLLKTGYASEAAAWTLLVDVLRDRQRPADWQHYPDIVKGRRCSEQGISSEAASLRVDIEHWQEETGNAGLPTTDQHQKLRLRINKHLSADRQATEAKKGFGDKITRGLSPDGSGRRLVWTERRRSGAGSLAISGRTQYDVFFAWMVRGSRTTVKKVLNSLTRFSHLTSSSGNWCTGRCKIWMDSCNADFSDRTQIVCFHTGRGGRW